MRLITVKKTGKRYIYNGEHRDVVACKGEVVGVQGCSATHGPDKRFKRDAVWVVEVDLSEKLLTELYEQNPDKPSPKIEPVVDPPEPKWVEWERDWDGKNRARLTGHADRRLQEMGYDAALDLPDLEEYAQDAAMDMAMYIPELTREGVREGLTPCREAAADMLYEGMMKALEEKRAASKKTNPETP